MNNKLPPLSEHQIQDNIQVWLKWKKIWNKRFNTGAVKYKSAKGRESYVRFGFVGMSDILAAPLINGVPTICFIEVKSEKGKMSPGQEYFQMECEQFGMLYIVARSSEDVEKAIEDYAKRHRKV